MVRQLLSFARAHARELLRDKRAIIAVLVSFAVLIGLLCGIDTLMATTTGARPGLVRLGLPLVAATGFMAVAFTLTTVPLIRYRDSGVLRTLSTTPAHRAAFLLAHAPVRATIVALETLVIVVVALTDGTPPAKAAPLATTLLLGGAMTLAFGYLLAARSTNLDTAIQLSYIIPMVVLTTSGVLFPLDLLPPPIAQAFRALPTTWLMESLGSLLVGANEHMPLTLSWILMTLVTMTAGYAAARCHRWTTEG